MYAATYREGDVIALEASEEGLRADDVLGASLCLLKSTAFRYTIYPLNG